MSYKVFELELKLREIEPPIWRTLEVPGSSSLEDVHFAIQVAMGWTNSHLHQFDIAGTRYGMVDVDEACELEDERAYSLEDLVRSGSSFVYEYDFGDGWEHDVKVVNVTPVAKSSPARCTAGARACPPEDCGGPGGYANLLEALADPRTQRAPVARRVVGWLRAGTIHAANEGQGSSSGEGGVRETRERGGW